MKPSTVVFRILLSLMIAGAAIWVASSRGHFDPGALNTAMRDLGAWAPLGFVVLYALATVLFVPGAVFGLAGGALFGPWWGTAVNVAGATLGATLAFLTARYLAADWVRRKAGGRVERLIEGVEAEGWRFVAFTRLIPLFPFNVLNYALGLTRISLTHYVAASFVCMLPGTLAFTWLGHAGREAVAGDATAVRYGLLALALLAAVAFLPRWLRQLRQNAVTQWIDRAELAARLGAGPDGVTVIDVRDPDEFTGALGHITHARNLPIDDLPQRAQELDPSRDKTVVLVCHTDKRSAKAAAMLRDAGFRDVRVLRGGMMQWNQPS